MRALVVVIVASLLAGCGPNCSKACERVYDDCQITKPGQEKGELLQDCVTECEDALLQDGDVGDYQPNRPRSSQNRSIILENESQAAAWMDCVFDVAPDATAAQCQQLDPSVGYCAPI